MHDSQSRMLPRRSMACLLTAIFLLALGLRVWGISFGLPYELTIDEVHEIFRALKLGVGEYSWTGGKGGLYLILFVEYVILYAVWFLTGKVQGSTDFVIRYLQDPTPFYLLGRVTVAVMGAMTCLVVFAVGRRIYGARVGIIAALICATAYHHAMWSHSINVDTGMTLAMLASVLTYLRYEHERHWRWLVAAGVLAGIAVAFKLPGAMALPILLLAIATAPVAHADVNRKFKEAGILLVSMICAIAIISPENILALPSLGGHFFSRLLVKDAVAASGSVEWADIFEITVLHDARYLPILLQPHNVVLTGAAVIGMAAGLWRRNRWDIIWIASIGSCLLVLSLADRGADERYLMPVIPAFWLLGARGIEFLGRGRPAIMGLVLAAVLGPSLFALVEHNHTATRPDTRVLTKEWVEKNVAPDTKILMDGMRFRFVQSAPLVPNAVSLARRMEAISEAEGRVSRGMSVQIIELYETAMNQRGGPRYDLYSTVYGLGVRELDHYVDSCFKYVITSSSVTQRLDRPGYADRFPLSARFYTEIQTDPRFELVYSAEPVRWRIQGPTIRVFRIETHCG